MVKSIRSKIAVVLGSVALMLLGSGSVASAGIAASGDPGAMDHTFELRNFNSGKCLEVPDWRTDNGAHIQQWSCVGISPQKWHYETVVPGEVPVVRVYNDYSNKCLDLAALGNGAPVVQWDCWFRIKTQEWYLYQTCWCADPGIILYNSVSGKVLEIADSYRWDGAPAQIWQYDSNARTQVWFER